MTKKKKIVKSHKPKTVSRKVGRCEEMLFAGFGGQGIMFMGKLLAAAALGAGKHVTWMPSYGAEVRGGTAYSMTKISDDEIAGPVVVAPDILVVMNSPSLLKYEGKLKDGGTLIANRSLVGSITKRKGIKYITIPMTDIAVKIGNVRCANMVALGAVARASKMVALRNIVGALKEAFKDKEELFLINKKALEKGHSKG